MNTQSEKPKFHGTKTDPKKISKILMPHKLTQMITQQPLLLLKPQRKLFLSLLFSNQKHAAKQL